MFLVLVAIIRLEVSIALVTSSKRHLHISISLPPSRTTLLYIVIVGGTNSTIAFVEAQSVVIQCICIVVESVYNII